MAGAGAAGARLRTAIGAAALVALTACGDGGGGASPAATAGGAGGAATAAPGPPPGGLELLAAHREALTTEAPLLSRQAAAGVAGDLTGATGAAQAIHDAQAAFDGRLRQIRFDASVASLVKAALDADAAYVAALGRQAAAAGIAELAQLHTAAEPARAAEAAAVLSLAEGLGAETEHPTVHLGDALPAAVTDSLATPGLFGSESGTGFDAGYGPAGYSVTTAGVVSENVDKDLSQSAQSVEAYVSASGQIEPGVTCLSAGRGTQAGVKYVGAVNPTTGEYVLQMAGPSGSTLFGEDTSPAIPRGAPAYRLRLDCVDHYLTFFVDGQPVFQTYDAGLGPGNAGINALGTGGTGGTAVFSDFSLKGR